MARGFESKQIEFQQEEAARGRRPSGPLMTAPERAMEERRSVLELSRKRAQHDLGRATASAHRRMLEQAIAAINTQIAELSNAR